MADRYYNTDIVQDTDTMKRVYKSTYLPSIPVQDSDVYMTTKYGDRLDTIAYNTYGDVTLWWVIALANNMTDMLVPAGIQLRIPIDVSAVLELVNQLQTTG